MPRIVSHTPTWLTRPSAAFDALSGAQVMAVRGSEVFAAVGKEIRWADLVALKEDPTSAAYRTLRISVPLPITRLVISPFADYMAISTSHTVHVVILPDSSLLTTDGPIKPKTFQIGPTAHVREESPVASILWHPLGYHGRCLVTITREGVVRLWELNRSDRSTFSDPALSIDLQKLANASSDEDNLSASVYGASKGFSPDSVELEVAAACFGDFPEQEGVHGWAPMTLWIAMLEGDVYALCPLLPSKWQLADSPGASTFLQTLASSISTNLADVDEDKEAPPEELENARKQYSWLSDMLYQEPFKENMSWGDAVKVYLRPGSVSPYPLLQGPFSLAPEVDDFELCDIIAFTLKTLSDSTNEDYTEGLPAAVVCLLTDTSKVHICLDVEGIAARWLPSPSDTYKVSESPEHALVVAETIALTSTESVSHNQTITTDVHTDFSFFVSRASGVFYVSLEPWIRKLESELSEPQNEGAEFRLERLIEAAKTQVEQCLHRPQHVPRAEDGSEQVTSCVVMEDGNLGYMVLTTVDKAPHAVVLDAPDYSLPTEEELHAFMSFDGPPSELRPSYHPPRELYQPSRLLQMINQAIPARHKPFLREEIRLSPANLEILLGAHKVLSQETQQLQNAVSDLFRRCERLRDEFRDQIYRTSQLADKIDSAVGIDEDGSDSGSEEAGGNARINQRLDRVKSKQEALEARYEAIRRKAANIGGPELSDKEAGWMDELSTMERSLDKSAQNLTDDVDGSERAAWERLEQVWEAKRSLAKEVEGALQGKEERASTGMKVPSQSRKQENEQVDALLQRETALVEAATGRLRSLGIAIPLEG